VHDVLTDNTHSFGVIVGDPRVYGRVYMGSFGRGIVRADIASGSRVNVPGTGGI